MDWKDLKGIIGNIAPALGTIIAGPAGAVVGTGLARALNVDPTPAAVNRAIATDPEAHLKLFEFQKDYQLAILEQELADKQDARARHKDHWMPVLLTIVLALMVSGMFAGILNVEMSAGVESIAYLIAGQVLTAFLTGVSFWLGTSRSSQEKTRLMKKE